MKRRPSKLRERLTGAQKEKRAERIAERANGLLDRRLRERTPFEVLPKMTKREAVVDLPRKQRCPVCLSSKAMLHFKNEREWECRGCGSGGLLWLTGKKHPELLVTSASEHFDFFNRRGIRERLVAQIRKDWRKIERERRESEAA